MRKHPWIIFLLISLVTPGSILGGEAEINKDLSSLESYQAAIQSYQQGQIAKAQEQFLLSLEKSPDNTFVLYNLGLTDYQLGKYGRALGAWRKALYFDPNFSLAKRAIAAAIKEKGPIQSDALSSWEIVRKEVVLKYSLNESLAAAAIMLLLGGSFLIRYSAQRRQAFKMELPLPPTPYLGILSSVFFFLFVTLTLFRAIDYFSPRATVISGHIDIRSGPSGDDASLFEILEGHEVIVKKVAGDWVQVAYPGGLTGWAEKSVLFHHSGKTPW